MERVVDAQVWDTALLALPQPHILQSWLWGEVKACRGWRPLRFLWREDNRPVAAAQLLVLQRGNLRLGYVPKGPLLDWTNTRRADDVLSQLGTYARKHRLLLLKIDPDVRADTEEGRAVEACLTQNGWRASFEQIQFRNTMLLDLRPDLDQLMAQMKPKWRYNIHLAVRKGVTVRDATPDDVPLLFAMYAETAARDSFIIREEAYYRDVWTQFMRAGLSWSLIAEVNGVPVAMAIAFHFGTTVWYMYGASRDIERSAMPTYLLQWSIIRRAKETGCTLYDLWGAPEVLEITDPLWGVYRFKAGFGATFVPHLGAYDYGPHLWLYRLYALLRPRAVAMAHHYYWVRARRV
ncbi:MAG TPA: peptidoglycan bridge formation glycyltransferase FemA/FemB family protein [Anaerolineae bacterium]|nr:peptidoglycan bridge formation glycyltransferase FemA/FemB family protein [Anaerolineae bacterium]HQK13372.1 peptidoglycan bridge formation glycyltransferase FemA/FemB family protein [Anaerolineae bacterium]